MLTGIHTHIKKLINGLMKVIALSLPSDILKDALRKSVSSQKADHQLFFGNLS